MRHSTSDYPPERSDFSMNTPYLAFSKDTPLQEAVDKFQDRYGVVPKNWGIYKAILFVGPIPLKSYSTN